MKFTTDLKEFKLNLKRTSYNTSTDYPNVLLESYNDNLSITTQTHQTLTVFNPIIGIKSGRCIVNLKALSKLLNSLKSPQVSLDLQDDLVITNNEITATLKTFPIDPDYSSYSFIHNPQVLQIAAAEFLTMTRAVLPSIGSDRLRSDLSQVLIHTVNTHLRLVSTDACRLTLAESTSKYDLELRSFLDLSAIKELIRNFTSGTVSISVQEKYLLFSSSTATLRCPVTKVNFPNYESLVTLTELDCPFSVSSNLLRSSIEQASVFSPKLSRMTFSLSSNLLKIATASSGNHIEATLPVSYDSTEVSVDLNHKFILDSLKIFTSDVVQLSISARDRPAYLWDPVNNITVIVMPLNSISRDKD